MAASSGCVFDRTDELIERLQQAPGEEARQEVAPTPDGPAPSRWTLRGVRATFPWLKNYTLSGVWRVLHRHGLHIRAAQVRQHSPDPEYAAKLDRLLECLRDAATHPGEVVLVFLDEMGYYRWPAEGHAWGQAAPAPAPPATPPTPGSSFTSPTSAGRASTRPTASSRKPTTSESPTAATTATPRRPPARSTAAPRRR